MATVLTNKFRGGFCFVHAWKGQGKKDTHTCTHTTARNHTHTYMYVHIPTSTSCVLHTPGLFMCVVCMCALVTHVLVQVCRLDET